MAEAYEPPAPCFLLMSFDEYLDTLGEACLRAHGWDGEGEVAASVSVMRAVSPEGVVQFRVEVSPHALAAEEEG